MADTSKQWKVWTSLEAHFARYNGVSMWYENEGSLFYVKLDQASPGNLAWDVLHAHKDIPRYNSHLEIIGNDVRELPEAPPLVFPDDFDEDCSEELSQLPIIDYNPVQHFKKPTSYKQEIHNLLNCRGSPFVVQLLGRTKNGELVFLKFQFDMKYAAAMFLNNGHRNRDIRRWMLQIIECILFLHSKGIVHRDLLARNIFYSPEQLVVCDLQCRIASEACRAYEADDFKNAKFSFASDIFSPGTVLWESCFYNNPINRTMMLDTPPPPPFRNIFHMCTAKKLEDRPTLAHLRAIYEAIEVPGEDDMVWRVHPLGL